jgi:hypothetical protein
MNLCYEFENWTMVTFALVSTTFRTYNLILPVTTIRALQLITQVYYYWHNHIMNKILNEIA